MKVILLMSQVANGGLERVQFQLAEGLTRAGHEVAIAARAMAVEMSSSFPAGVRRLVAKEASRLAFPAWIYRMLRAEAPDVVMTSANDLACLLLMMKWAAFPGMRVIVSQHLSISGPIAHSKGFRKAKLIATRIAMSRLLRGADAIVAVSGSVAADMAHALKLPSRSIRTIYNPVAAPSPSLAYGSPLPPTHPVWGPDHPPVVLYVGRLRPEKRPDLLIEAFDQVRRQRDVRLAIVGSGPLAGWIEAELERRGLRELVWMPGFLPDVTPVLRAASVLVLPSDYEGFGLVLVEAMACGLQVVATDCPSGPAEILEDGRWGALTPPNDAGALADAIIGKLTGRTAVPEADLIARAADFSPEKSIGAYLRLIEDAGPRPAASRSSTDSRNDP